MRRLAPLFVLLFLCGAAEAFAAPVAPLDLRWRYGTGGQIRSRPAVAPDGTVYAISDDGYLYALSPEGGLAWRHNLGWIVADCLAIGADGTIYAGLRNDDLVAVNPRGSEIWRVRLDGLPSGDPLTTPDGQLFVGTKRGTLYAISLGGRIEWTIQLPAAITHAPVMDGGGNLYLVGGDRRLYALTSGGGFRWSLPFRSAPSEPAIGLNGELLVATAGGEVSEVTPSGDIAWSYPVGGSPFAPIVNAGPPGPRASAPAGASRPAVVVATGEGTVVGLGEDGRPLWRTELAVGLSGDCMAGKERILLLTRNGMLVSLTEGGRIAARLALGTSGGSVLTADGSLYLGGRNWIISAVQVSQEAALDRLSAWPESGHDPQHSGRAARGFDDASLVPSEPDSYALYLESLFSLGTRDAFTRILSEVRERARRGSLGREVGCVVPVLEGIAKAGILAPVYEDNRIRNDFPDLRAQAGLLLGSLGTLHSRGILIRLVARESDELALAAEIEALGLLGSDADGAAEREIAAAYARFTRFAADGRIAAAVVGAFQGISRYEGRLSASADGCLAAIATADYPDWIRIAASELLSGTAK